MMDTYDIFKKLTRGTKFAKRHNPIGKQNGKQNEQAIQTSNVKQELLSDDEVKSEITLINSFIGNENAKKGKKRKAQNAVDTEKKRVMLEKEKVNQYRNQLGLNVVGSHAPQPVKTFDELNIDADLIENIKKCGYVEPTIIQQQALPVMLEGRQILACAPTGSGKTAAFLLPIISDLIGPKKEGFRAVIICPTRELAKQTQRECIRLAGNREFSVHIISNINRAINQYGLKSSKKFDILVTTPKRLCFLLNQDSAAAISLVKVQWLVIDEADKLFESGIRGFREQLQQILKACTFKELKIAMFSATYMPVVAKWCRHHMKGLIRVMVGQRNTATDLVDQELLFVGNEAGKLLAFRNLVHKGLTPPVLIFVQSPERAQQLFSELIYDGINVDAIHSGRTQQQRDNTVRSFREGQIWVLICTELMSRGIDFKGVNLVINYDFPSSSISYVHRIGRAGRAGRRGKAITFFTTEDTVNLRSIAFVLRQSGCDIPDYMLKLKQNSRREKKKRRTSAPKRDDISTKTALRRKNRRNKKTAQQS